MTEGGSKHIMHLHENISLTFGEIKRILQRASSGQLEGTEKIDGQNILLTFSVPQQVAKAARNKTELKKGGLSKRELSSKYSSRKNVRDTFVFALELFENAVKKMPIPLQLRLFGEDPKSPVFFNCEVQNPDLTNVINYDSQNLVIHRTGHVKYDPEVKSIVRLDNEKNLETLEAALEMYQRDNIDGAQGFKVVTNSIVRLRALSDDRALQNAVKGLSSLQRQAGISDSQTIGDYLVARLDSTIHKIFPDLSSKSKGLIIRKILGDDIPPERISKSVSDPDAAGRIKDVLSDSKRLISDAINPIEMIIHDFAVEILKAQESAFILNNKKEVERLRSEVSNAIEVIKSSDNEHAIEVLHKQLQKLKDTKGVSSAIEGFTFSYGGKIYKFTGNFAPVNQILGLLKYGRGKKIPPLSRLVRTARTIVREQVEPKSGMTYAIFPGKFKPPHFGHVAVARHVAKDPRVDKVIVLISPKSIQAGYITISAEESRKIWELLTIDDPKIEIRVSPNSSPVRGTFMFAEALNPGDKVYAILSQKEMGVDAKRFEGLQAWVDKKAPGVMTQILPVPDAPNMSSTAMRRFIEMGDKLSFFEGIGDATSDVKNSIWEIVTGEAPARNEMTTMAGASVAGAFAYESPFKRRKQGG